MKPDQFKNIITNLNSTYRGESKETRQSWTEILVNLFNRVPLGNKETIKGNDFFPVDKAPDHRYMAIDVIEYIDAASLLTDRKIVYVNHTTASFEIYIERIVKMTKL